MEERKFNSEAEIGGFKEFCAEILPAVKSIEEALNKREISSGASIRFGKEGYIAAEVHDSRWRMMRYSSDGPFKVMYERTEELDVPDNAQMNKVTENLVEISLVFASLQPEITQGREIDSLAWKQELVSWANQFERMYENVEWGTDETAGRDYLEVIEEFAEKKIREFAGIGE